MVSIPFVILFFDNFIHVFPIEINDDLRNRIQISLFFLPVLFPILGWIFEHLKVIHGKLTFYNNLHSLYVNKKTELFAIKKTFFDFLIKYNKKNMFEIKSADFQEGGFIFSLYTNDSINPSLGNSLYIMDLKDDFFLGIAEVIDIQRTCIYLQGKTIDPLFAGHIREEKHLTSLPNLRALYVPIKEE